MSQSQEGPEFGALALPNFEEDETELLGMQSPARRPRPWWRRRRWIVTISIILLVVLLLGSAVVVLRNRRARVSYQEQQVTQGNLTLAVTATGPVQGVMYNVNFSTSGKIAEIDVAVGQKVKAGDTLARLDQTSLQDAVNQAQLSVNSAQTGLNDAETNLSNVQAQTAATVTAAQNQEQNALYTCDHTPNPPPDCKALARSQFTQAQKQADTQNASAQAQVDTSQGQLNTANAQLRTAQHNLNDTTLTAPHDGTVAAINGSVGSVPGGGSASGSGSTSTVTASAGAFIQIVDLSSLQVSTNVNEADIGGVSIGNGAQFIVSTYGAQQFNGTVGSIAPLGQNSSNVVTYTVLINVDMGSLQGASLLPGMTASVSITTVRHTNVVLVSADAVNFARTLASQNDARGTPYVDPTQIANALAKARQMVLDLQAAQPAIIRDQPTPAYILERSNNALVVKPVVLGLTDGTNYEALAGLDVGENIIVGATGIPLNGTGTPTGFTHIIQRKILVG